MGANISGGLTEFDRDGDVYARKPGLVDLPENCVALIMTRLDPPEICRLARLNRMFRRASSADFIWESKLPSNYRVIAHKVFDEITLRKLIKKDLYAKLSRPNLFEDGTKVRNFVPVASFSLNLRKRNKIFSFSNFLCLSRNCG